ncbi:MAG: AAA family ATPase [Desulfuromonadaceae bacterium]|nr:AAA family ATPase [Desulfuromonadaceae bacterium]MDD5107655.1 AAA family ATPase [Desulfuromonadaceae bacterium]
MSPSAITPYIPELLRNPRLYPVQTTSVELVQTHVSWLFLTDTHVFKIKKPVNFGFLDFSTLELRHFYCQEELRLNRRLCPDIYEQVIPLRENGSQASFRGDGAIIDYAVMMKRLPADRMLDALINSNRLFVDDIRVIVHQISAFHAHAAMSPYISGFGSLDQIRFNWQENFDQTLPFTTSTLPQAVRNSIITFVEDFMREHAEHFAERVENGYIRECDGDIHLGNICLTNGTAYIFDCIEFNERFRYSDTAADIAFLLMDLDFHGRRDLANSALYEYISASGDENSAVLIVFYKVYRAFVRGKVESMQLLDSGITGKTRTTAEQRAVRYFRLARGYCVMQRLPPTLFITCGTMGCGKSTLVAALAFELGVASYSSDIVRKKLVGLPPDTPARTPFGEGLYSNSMNLATYTYLEKMAAAELTAGRSVVIDAGFASAVERSRFAECAALHQATFVVLFTQCEPAEQLHRLRERAARGYSVSDGREELLKLQERGFEPPDLLDGNVIPCNTGTPVEHILDMVYERLFTS